MIQITLGQSLKSFFHVGERVYGAGRTGVIEDIYTIKNRRIGDCILDGYEMALVDFGDYKGEVALSLLSPVRG